MAAQAVSAKTCTKRPDLEVRPLFWYEENPDSWGHTHRHTETDTVGATSRPCSGKISAPKDGAGFPGEGRGRGHYAGD